MKTLTACCFALILAITPATASVLYDFTGTAPFSGAPLTLGITFPSYDTGQYQGDQVIVTGLQDLSPCLFNNFGGGSSGEGFECASSTAQSGVGYFGAILTTDTYPTSDGTYAIASSEFEDYAGEPLGGSLTSLTITTIASTAPEPSAWLLVLLGLCSYFPAIRRQPGNLVRRGA